MKQKVDITISNIPNKDYESIIETIVTSIENLELNVSVGIGEDDEDNKPTNTITVCDKCLRASCWQNRHMCKESRRTMRTSVEKTIEELTKLYLEHHSYWEMCS